MSRLRLLLTTDAVGGVWTYSLDLAQALADADDVGVAVCDEVDGEHDEDGADDSAPDPEWDVHDEAFPIVDDRRSLPARFGLARRVQ